MPNADTLRSSYVPKVREEQESLLKNAVLGKFVGIMCDETTDRKGQCIFIVLIKILECNSEPKMYVGGVKTLKSADHKECCRAILDVLNKYEIPYDSVVFIASDSARYMGKCYRSLKDGFLSDKLIHIECWAHKLNLVGNIWQIELTELNECVTNAKNAFNNARKRKNHYIFHLKNNHPHMTAKQFPLPVMTRWNSWYHSVEYVNEYLTPMVEFLKNVEDGGTSIHYFKNLTMVEIVVIQCQAAFVVEHCKSTIDAIVVLEGSSYPYAHKLHAKLKDLQRSYIIIGEGNFNVQTTALLQQLQPKLRTPLIQKLKNVALKSSTKLSSLQLLDPATDFLTAISKLFNPRDIVTTTNEEVKASAKNVPFLSDLTTNVGLLLEGYCALKAKVCSEVSQGRDVVILTTLLGLKADHSDFVESAVRAIWLPVSNVDSERGFSAYNNVLTDKRTTLTPENVELMVALTFGD